MEPETASHGNSINIAFPACELEILQLKAFLKFVRAYAHMNNKGKAFALFKIHVKAALMDCNSCTSVVFRFCKALLAVFKGWQ